MPRTKTPERDWTAPVEHENEFHNRLVHVLWTYESAKSDATKANADAFDEAVEALRQQMIHEARQKR